MSGQLSAIRIGQVRKAAIDLLQKYHVANPEAIDLETLAWRRGRLRIKVGGLDGAEGRLVATDGEGGVIRVASDQNRGRFRFTVAHEIGHFVLHQHGVVDKIDTRREMTIWNDASEEAEANCFAAELLMPEYLFRSYCVGKPSIQLLDDLAATFGTSTLATVFQYWEYTREPVALVLSEGWRMKSFRPFKDGWPKIRYGQVHKDSAAGERLSEKSGDSCGMVSTPAYAWLEGFGDRPEKSIMEDSRYLDYYDTTLTLLWHDEPLDDDDSDDED
jgi:Zn-dependent peptidase ImmA (M78 family)